MNQYNNHPLKQKYVLWYTGYLGHSQPSEQQFSSSLMKITEKTCISDLAEFYRVMNVIPMFDQVKVQKGFTYYWFHEGVEPAWEKHPNFYQLEYKFEIADDRAERDEDHLWSKTKAEHEAHVVKLLMYCVGNVDELFTEKTKGIIIKIRRARIIVQLWMDCDDVEVDGYFKGFQTVFGFDQRYYSAPVVLKQVEATSKNTSRAHSTRSQGRDRSQGDRSQGGRDKSQGKRDTSNQKFGGPRDKKY